MQKYTELKIQDLRSNLAQHREEEWGMAVSNLAARGMFHSGTGLLKIMTIGFDSVQKIIDDFLKFESMVLKDAPSKIDDNYYQDLKFELYQIVGDEIDAITKKIFSIYKDYEKVLIIDQLNKKRTEFESIINRRIEILKEEIKLGLSPAIGAVINITGDVGVLNSGSIYGDVHGKIEKLNRANDAEIKKAFNSILEEIKSARIDEQNRINQMQNVELLIEQYEKSKAERKSGLISAALSFLSMASNLSTVWGQFGPYIIEAFKIKGG